MTLTIVPIRCGDIVNHERSRFLYGNNFGKLIFIRITSDLRIPHLHECAADVDQGGEQARAFRRSRAASLHAGVSRL
jgi:hypothetical protein